MVKDAIAQKRGGWIVCPDCDTLHQCGPVKAPHDVKCANCGRTLFSRTENPLDRPLAFALAGLVFFIPANVYPIVTFSFHGVKTDNILVTGVMRLGEGGFPGVGLLVFLASVLFPALYLLGMTYVLLCSRLRQYPGDFALTLRMTQGLNRWGMIDVYLLACMISFIKLGQLATVLPGPGLYCLGGVLICTLLASLGFDPDLLWRRFGARSDAAGSWNLLKSKAS